MVGSCDPQHASNIKLKENSTDNSGLVHFQRRLTILRRLHERWTHQLISRANVLWGSAAPIASTFVPPQHAPVGHPRAVAGGKRAIVRYATKGTPRLQERLLGESCLTRSVAAAMRPTHPSLRPSSSVVAPRLRKNGTVDCRSRPPGPRNIYLFMAGYDEFVSPRCAPAAAKSSRETRQSRSPPLRTAHRPRFPCN